MQVIDFKTTYRNDKATEWVLLAPRGETGQSTQTWHRVDKLRPPENPRDAQAESLSYQVMKERWDAIEPAYNAWKDGTEIPTNGIPLAAWSGVSQDQADLLKMRGIKTVEDVAQMSDSAIQQLPFPDARRLKETAKKYLDGRDATAANEKLQEAEDRIAAMEEMIASMQADKPKRGRPPKKESEAA